MTPHYEELNILDALSIASLFTFSRRTFPPDYRFEGETHDFTEVVCIVHGRACITADKLVYVLSEGQLVVHPPNEFHKIRADGVELEPIIFSFRATHFPALCGSVFRVDPERLRELKEIFKAAQRVFLFEKERVTGILAGRETEASALVKRLELFLLSVFEAGEDVENSPRRSAENYTRIVSVMQESLGEGLSAEELAKRSNCSVSALEKTIRRYSGRGAMAHYNHLRMQRAAELLSEGKSVKEVSSSLGFSNQNYFSLAFKKWSGLSPTRYRK